MTETFPNPAALRKAQQEVAEFQIPRQVKQKLHAELEHAWRRGRGDRAEGCRICCAVRQAEIGVIEQVESVGAQL